MDLKLRELVGEITTVVADAESVHAVGARTQWDVGGAPFPGAVEVRSPIGIAEYDPADLTVRVRAGTAAEELASVLAASGQECPLDPRSPSATVGGILACGLSGIRRLRYGPVRDRVLEVSFVTADGRLVRGGGPTVKNVSGFDLPRLLVGSLGTIGVMVEVVLRCQPLPAQTMWSRSDADPDDLRRRAYRPSTMVWDGETTAMLFEGHADDLAAQARALGGAVISGAPSMPEGPHRGRISVRPARVRALGEKLATHPGIAWLAELGVGTVHVAAEHDADLAVARAIAEEHGGWLLREAGAPGIDGFGCGIDNPVLARRVRDAFDPTGKLGRGRFPW